jgi:hypothetical protein
MFQSLLPTTIRSIETQRRCENGSSALSCLNCSGGEASAGAHALDMIYDGDLGVASKDKVAVHAVHEEVVRYGSLSGGQALRDHGAAVDAARTGGMP